MKKRVALIVAVVMMLMSFSVSAQAAPARPHEHTDLCVCCEEENDFSELLTADHKVLEGEGSKNLICAIFGHKLTNTVKIFNCAQMIDSKRCTIWYDEVGYCDRCHEYVDILKSEVVNHNLRTSGSHTYCTYGCGYEYWSLK